MDDDDDECSTSRTRTQSVLLYLPSIRAIHVPRNKDPFIFSFQIKRSQANQPDSFFVFGDPKGNRTPVAGVRDDFLGFYLNDFK